MKVKGHESLGLKGEIEFLVIDKEGNIRERRVVRNVITNDGKASVAGLILADVSETPYDYVAIGTGTTSASASDTALEAETHRVAGTGSRVTTSTTNDTAQLQATFNFSASYSITESGVFNASSGGTMLCRQTFSAINVNDGDSLQITWKIQVQ